jgi:hypothetical protein
LDGGAWAQLSVIALLSGTSMSEADVPMPALNVQH